MHGVDEERSQVVIMVNDITKEIFICPFCKAIYDDELDAEECVKECIYDRYYEEPIMEFKSGFQCECCEKVFRKSSKAEECEEKHKNADDKYYQMYLDKVTKEKLKKASKHKTQTKLFRKRKKT